MALTVHLENTSCSAAGHASRLRSQNTHCKVVTYCVGQPPVPCQQGTLSHTAIHRAGAANRSIPACTLTWEGAYQRLLEASTQNPGSL